MSKDYVVRLSTLPMHATVGGNEGAWMCLNSV